MTHIINLFFYIRWKLLLCCWYLLRVTKIKEWRSQDWALGDPTAAQPWKFIPWSSSTVLGLIWRPHGVWRCGVADYGERWWPFGESLFNLTTTIWNYPPALEERRMWPAEVCQRQNWFHQLTWTSPTCERGSSPSACAPALKCPKNHTDSRALYWDRTDRWLTAADAHLRVVQYVAVIKACK